MNKGNKFKIAIFTIVVLLFVVGGYFLMKWSYKDDDKPADVAITYSDATPLLYKATDGKTNIYLLGSIHGADDSAYEFNQNILDIYNKADALAVEFDIIEFEKDLEAQMAMVSMLAYDDASTIKDHIDAELYTKLTELLKKKKLYSKIYEIYKPTMFESLLEAALMEDAGLDSEKGIDRYFIKKAKKDNKRIIDVESAEFQYKLMDSLPEYAVIESIREVVDNYDDSVNELKELYSIWKEGNADKIVKLLTGDDEDISNHTPEEIEIRNEYNKMMLTDRNIGMTDVMEENLKNGTNVFCVVGLAHIVGDGGMVDLLQKRGYTVELVEYNS